jgi:Lar family restriction alleviation protein
MTNTMTPETRKPCPFCGGNPARGHVNYHAQSETARLNKQSQFYFINCVECGASNQGMVGFSTEDDAIAAWNRREPSTLLDAVRNLIAVKGRHQTEVAYNRLVVAYDAAVPKDTP